MLNILLLADRRVSHQECNWYVNWDCLASPRGRWALPLICYSRPLCGLSFFLTSHLEAGLGWVLLPGVCPPVRKHDFRRVLFNVSPYVANAEYFLMRRHACDCFVAGNLFEFISTLTNFCIC